METTVGAQRVHSATLDLSRARDGRAGLPWPSRLPTPASSTLTLMLSIFYHKYGTKIEIGRPRQYYCYYCGYPMVSQITMAVAILRSCLVQLLLQRSWPSEPGRRYLKDRLNYQAVHTLVGRIDMKIARRTTNHRTVPDARDMTLINSSFQLQYNTTPCACAAAMYQSACPPNAKGLHVGITSKSCPFPSS